MSHAGSIGQRVVPLAIRHDLVFSLNSFVAACLALYIGLRIGLPRPAWSVLTVYITAHPLTGALRSKAVFRVLGTLLGAIAAVVILPPLVNRPSLATAAMAIWSGLCLYLSLLDRRPRAYVFMLAGYTGCCFGKCANCGRAIRQHQSGDFHAALTE